jgi:hypothetical protein
LAARPGERSCFAAGAGEGGCLAVVGAGEAGFLAAAGAGEAGFLAAAGPGETSFLPAAVDLTGGAGTGFQAASPGCRRLRVSRAATVC